jgi:hypothetical protein
MRIIAPIDAILYGLMKRPTKVATVFLYKIPLLLPSMLYPLLYSESRAKAIFHESPGRVELPFGKIIFI